MILRRIAAVGVVAAAATVASVVPASAGMAGWETDQGASVDFVSMAVHGDQALVTIRYTCGSDASPANHLFAAVKQGGGVDSTNRSGSSFTRSFYSTNWSADTGANALTCDGTEQTQTLVLMQDPFYAPSRKAKALHDGVALVQLCLFANLVGDPDHGGTGDLSFDYSMQQVRGVS